MCVRWARLAVSVVLAGLADTTFFTCAAVFFGLFNPVLRSFATLEAATLLECVCREFGCSRTSLGSLSQAVEVFDPRRLEVILQPDRCYVMDRWYGEFTWWNVIVQVGSSYVCRIRDNSKSGHGDRGTRPVSRSSPSGGTPRHRGRTTESTAGIKISSVPGSFSTSIGKPARGVGLALTCRSSSQGTPHSPC